MGKKQKLPTPQQRFLATKWVDDNRDTISGMTRKEGLDEVEAVSGWRYSTFFNVGAVLSALPLLVGSGLVSSSSNSRTRADNRSLSSRKS